MAGITHSSGRPEQKSYAYSWYTAAVLMVAYTFSFLDRQILNLMVGPIKVDLHLTDTQFALLTGGAFGIFYTVMGLPIGWLADRYPRTRIIACGVALWSLATTCCAFARSFPMLMAARIGVGVGEATLSPSAYSLLSNSFDKSRLPRAMSVYSVGIYIGAGLALILGGSVVELVARSPEMHLPLIGTVRSWHAVFLVIGPPGLLVALWISTLREPARDIDHAAVETGRSFSLVRIGRFLATWPAMSVSLFLGSAMLAIMSYMDAWYPELFIRTFQWNAAQTGHVNGLASLSAGPIGMLSAGWLSSRMIARGRSDACLRLALYAAIGLSVFATAMPLMPDATTMAAMLWPIKFLGGFVPVLIPSAIQMIAPGNMRAQLSAVFGLTVGILAVTLGPVLPALIGDYILHDEKALNLSLALAAAIVGPVATLLLSVGLKQFRACLMAMQHEGSGPA
ncbi:MFS transporter [Sphingomonas sp. QA11]|uniref:MFS transporter n=1 Tax=Sphingomonas sp. QA11 TaxID=2950605 RepID=UPI00234A3257|nr:MFS transporter [Sphingomonas sp. QA11]WCM29477.1 MFS transporter [Sphingomonas sp. QA11]